MLDESTKARIIHHLNFEPQIGPELEPWFNEIYDDLEVAASNFINTFDNSDTYPFLHHLIFNGVDGEGLYLRFRARRAILKLKGRDPIVFLTELLSGTESGRRGEACRDLAAYPGDQSIRLLAHTLVHDEDPDVRFAAAESLELIGDETALPALRHAEQHDRGYDYGDFPIAGAARAAIRAIEARSTGPEPE